MLLEYFVNVVDQIVSYDVFEIMPDNKLGSKVVWVIAFFDD